MNLSQAQGAAQLVERARAGDQNAMGILKLVGDNARRGSAKARSAYELIQAYIRAHPSQGSLRIGAEEAQALGVLKHPENSLDAVLSALCTLPLFGNNLLIPTACVIMANCRRWDNPTVQAVDSMVAGAENNLFRFGFENSADPKKTQPVAANLPPQAVGVLCAGHCIGTARRIQLARMPGVSVGVLGPDVGWELGCMTRRR